MQGLSANLTQIVYVYLYLCICICVFVYLCICIVHLGVKHLGTLFLRSSLVAAHFFISCSLPPRSRAQPLFFTLLAATFVVGRVNHGLASSALHRTGRQHDDARVWAGRRFNHCRHPGAPSTHLLADHNSSIWDLWETCVLRTVINGQSLLWEKIR